MILAKKYLPFFGLLAFCPGFLFPLAANSAGLPDRQAATPWVETEQTRLRLVSGKSTVADGEALLGLQVELEPGWKIYWRSPGDAGFPPQFDWSGSQNLDGVEVLWPAPKRMLSGGIETLGYENEVVYPLVVRAARQNQPVKLRLNLDYGICKDICVPYNAQLALDLPPGKGEETVYATSIRKFTAMVPAKGEQAAAVGLSVSGARLEASEDNQTLVVTIRSDRPLTHPDLIVEVDPGPEGYSLFYFAPPETHIESGGRSAQFRVAVNSGKRKLSLAGTDVTLTLLDGDRAIEQRVTVTGQ